MKKYVVSFRNVTKERWFGINKTQWQHTNRSSTTKKKSGPIYLQNQAQNSGGDGKINEHSLRFSSEGYFSKQYVDFICLNQFPCTFKFIQINKSSSKDSMHSILLFVTTFLY